MKSLDKTTFERHDSNFRLSRRVPGIFPLLLILALSACYPANYREVPRQSAAPAVQPPVTQVYFYPLKGQPSEQQSRDHYECYNWAVSKTGFDPSQSSIPAAKRVKVVPMPPPGHNTAVLSIAGAVLGALIAGPRHAGAGALIGAGTGVIAGAVSDASRQEYSQQMEEAYNRQNQALDARYAQQAGDFRRAMSSCLEGRGYSVK
jgi:outer membrane lipoprotein SlyB